MKIETKAKLVTSLFPVVLILLIVGANLIPIVVLGWICMSFLTLLAGLLCIPIIGDIYSKILLELRVKDNKKDNKPSKE